MKIVNTIFGRRNIFFQKKIDLRKLFGVHKFSKPVDKLMREMDEDLYDD